METKRHKTGFSPQAYQLLKEHKWPGNVRELENSIEHAVVLGRTEEIQPNDLPISLRQIGELYTAYYDSSTDENTSLEEAQRRFKKRFIEQVLRSTCGNRSKAAQKLEIQRTYLSRLIKELNIEG